VREGYWTQLARTDGTTATFDGERAIGVIPHPHHCEILLTRNGKIERVAVRGSLAEVCDAIDFPDHVEEDS
jgi:hypothetical protein